ncbi:DUF4007 family protein [Streptomyces reticuliscabiei]|uniref:DUF4007 family protein n=1 Tax=Streptomyces reticuliscabiei TaxID=146821 RepID=UPI000A3A0ABC|nr:DUF4007 family protein [Streptomyces reticuliscabiei]
MSRSPLADFSGCVPAFGQHHGYPPRYGWLLKVHEALRADPLAFQRPDVHITLGVGASQVGAMRFWAQAFGLAAPSDGRALEPTARGRWLLDEDGADPYLEDVATYWVLHWWLLSAAPCAVPTWHFLIAQPGRFRYTRAELRELVRRTAEDAGWRVPADSTVARDISCLVTMYAPSVASPDQPRASIEDVLTNPFRDLGVLGSAPQADLNRRDRSHELSVNRQAGHRAPDAAVAYACLSYATLAAGTNAGGISVPRLATATGSPGRILLTDTTALRKSLKRGTQRWGLFDVVESSAGEDMLTYTEPPAVLASRVLAAHYQQMNGPDVPV